MKRVLTLFTMILVWLFAAFPATASCDGMQNLYENFLVQSTSQAIVNSESSATGIYLVALVGAQAVMNKPYAAMSERWIAHYALWVADQRGCRTGIGENLVSR